MNLELFLSGFVVTRAIGKEVRTPSTIGVRLI